MFAPIDAKGINDAEKIIKNTKYHHDAIWILMMKNGLHGEVLKIIDFRLNRKVFVIQRSNQIQDDFIRNLRMVFLVMLVDDDAV